MDIKVGDIVHLSCDEQVPADILLFRCKSAEEDDDDYGACYVETSNLDGESNLKQRFAVQNFCKNTEAIENVSYDFVVECDHPNKKLYKFYGFITYLQGNTRLLINKENLLLRDCVLKNTSFAEGMVIYAGHETKAMLNNKGPRHKRSRLEKMMNGDIIWCIIILIVMCTISALGRTFWLEDYPKDKHNVPFIATDIQAPFAYLEFLWLFFTFIILYQTIIPVSLYVAIEMVKLGQVYYIHRDEQLYDKVTNKRIECRALNITEDLGQIEYMFCDKTGTLTENKMEFRCCCINGVDYSHDTQSSSSEKVTYEQNADAIKSESFQLNRKLNDKILKLTKKYLKCSKKLSKRGKNLNLSTSKANNESKSSIKNSVLDETKVSEAKLNDEECQIRDFFVSLAICNTAVASNHDAHLDIMNAAGQLVDDDMSANIKLKIPPSPKQGESKQESTPNMSNAKKFKLFQMWTQSPMSDKSSKCINDSHMKTKPIYESESPDEVALVTAAFNYRICLLKRTKDYVNVTLPSGTVVTYQVLHLLPFDSNRKRMSIIVRCPFTKKIVLFCKGSDLTILGNLSSAFTNDSAKVNELEMTNRNLKKYSTKGFRVLCMAKRTLTDDELKVWSHEYRKAEISGHRQKMAKCAEDIEKDLELLGATAIEDRLQYRVPEVIAALKEAGIVIWVLTGDKMETAVNIANSCLLFNAGMNIIEISLATVKSKQSACKELQNQIDTIRQTIAAAAPDNYQITLATYGCGNTANLSPIQRKIKTIYDILNWRQKVEFVTQNERNKWGMVIDGPSLNFVLEKDNLDSFIELTQYCSSVLCCRMTPSQKSMVVKSVKKKLNALTLAVGDGANDVAMIQTAHVGVGISGLEGTQAVMASDFAISKFHYLERLILVHGNLCYNRLALTILYFFYKNTIFSFVIFLFQFACGFSGQGMIDDIYLMAVNIFYTTLPAMIRGIVEKDCNENTFLMFPSLYERGRNSHVYTNHSFWVNTTDSIYQSVVIYYACYYFYQDSDTDLYQFGFIILTIIVITNLLMIAMESKFWNKMYMFSYAISIAFYILTVIFLDQNNSSFLIHSIGINNYKVFQNTILTGKVWVTFLIVPLICIIPRCTLRMLQEMIKPSFRLY